jgi:hypothetical protein
MLIHFLLLLAVLYLFGAWILVLWQLNPIITIIAVTIAVGLAILEDFGQ